MEIGLVKWFNEASGYGFIVAEKGARELFVRQASIGGDSERTLIAGDRVQFAPREGGMGPEAIDVQPLAAVEECDHCSLEPVSPARAMSGADVAGLAESGRER